MNDKPTTGEWMASTVELMFMANPRNAHYAIAKAHNAALAYEQETYVKQREDWIREIQQLQEQLQELVDALKEIRDAGYTLTREDGTNVIDAALAKVKQ